MNTNHEIIDVETLYASEHFRVLGKAATYSNEVLGLKSVSETDLLIRPKSFIARKAGELAGFVSIQQPVLFDERWWSQVSTLAVFPGFEGNGIASSLVERTTDHIHANGFSAFALLDRDPTMPALPAFNKNGYFIQKFGDRVGVANPWFFGVGGTFLSTQSATT